MAQAFRMVTAEVANLSAKIATKKEELNTELTNLNSIEERIISLWEGQGKDSAQASLTGILELFKKLLNTIENSAEFLKFASNSTRKTDDDVSSSFNNIKY